MSQEFDMIDTQTSPTFPYSVWIILEKYTYDPNLDE